MTSPSPVSSWRDQLIAYLRQEASPAHKFGHQPRLFRLAQQLAAASPDLRCDDDVLFAAAYLHDLGVFVGHRPENPALLARWDHVAYACELAPSLLAGFGFPMHKLDAVLACIREHQPHDTPRSPEAKALRDADILEQLGAIAILRTAAKLGSDTRFFRFTDAHLSLQRALQQLPAQLQLPAARVLAAPRIAALQAFLASLDEEAGDLLG